MNTNQKTNHADSLSSSRQEEGVSQNYEDLPLGDRAMPGGASGGHQEDLETDFHDGDSDDAASGTERFPMENWPRVAIFLAGVAALVALLASLPEKAHAQVAGSPVASRSSTAVSATLVAFAGYSTMYNVVMYNSSGSTVYLQVFDTNAVPVNGTAPTLAPVQVPSHSTASITYDSGRRFTNGIVIGCSTTDTTFTSSGSGWMDCTYSPQ